MASHESIIQSLQSDLERMPVGDPDLVRCTHDLGSAYIHKYQATNSITDLENGMEHLEIALVSTPEEHPDRTARLKLLGEAYKARFQESENWDDLDMCIQLFKKVLDSIPAGRTDKRVGLLTVGSMYTNRYYNHPKKSRSDAEEAIRHLEEAREFDVPPNDAERASHLHQIRTLYYLIWKESNKREDLDNAIRFEESLISSPDRCVDQGRRVGCSATLYCQRYLCTKSVEDFSKADQNYRAAIDSTPEESLKITLIVERGMLYHESYKQTGIKEHLDISFQQLQDGIKLTSTADPARVVRLQFLLGLYNERFATQKTIADLDNSVDLAEEIFRLVPDHHPEKSMRLGNCSLAYSQRYKYKGMPEDLETSIRLGEEALKMTPTDDKHRGCRLEQLAGSYHLRYSSSNAIADLETAIEKSEESLKCRTCDDIDSAGRLHGLGTRYAEMYSRSEDQKDFQKCVKKLEDAVALTPEDHPHRPRRILSIVSVYGNQYTKTRSSKAREYATERSLELAKAITNDHPDRVELLSNLGKRYWDEYEISKELLDIERSIESYETALSSTLEDDPVRAHLFRCIAMGYTKKGLETKDPADYYKVVQRYQDALNHRSSPPADRLRVSTSLLDLLVLTKQWAKAYEAACTTMSLVPLLTPRFLQTTDRQHLLAEIVGIASDTVGIALEVGKSPYEALQLLESGRGIITSSFKELRTDISELQREHPDFAQKFTELRDQLDASMTSMYITGQRSEFTASRRYDAGQRLEQTIREIRQELPGFERFLLPPSEKEMRDAAVAGPIVVINVSHYRCDAFIIETHGIKVLPLPELKAADIRYRATVIRAQGTDNTNAAMGSETLEWLWNSVAKPILDTLGLPPPSAVCWPRIWWIPTGPLTKFPIHAAGYHFRETSDTVLDRVISSYSSSVKLLVQSRENGMKASNELQVRKVCLVGMPELQFAPVEIEQLKLLCTDMQLETNNPRSFRGEILKALDDCDIFHFAGHGFTDTADPSESALVLSRPEDISKPEDLLKPKKEPEPEKLTVTSLFQTNVQRRRPILAYLSACGTGQMKRDELVDEGIHLISAFQLAGFKHVIGTLWEVNDESCVKVAMSTYRWMQKADMSEDSISEGLHHASRCLRDQWVLENDEEAAIVRSRRPLASEGTKGSRTADPCEEKPLLWAPYVHFGI